MKSLPALLSVLVRHSAVGLGHPNGNEPVKTRSTIATLTWLGLALDFEALAAKERGQGRAITFNGQVAPNPQQKGSARGA
jgi:hypothetical protein